MLRDAASIENLVRNTTSAPSPPRKVQKLGAGLFRFRKSNCLLEVPSASEVPVLMDESSTAETDVEPVAEPETDTVADEMQRWKSLDLSLFKELTDVDGVLNEMALHYKLRHHFPLHCRVFRQVSSHLCHEANTEQLFSLAGGLSEDNGKMSPDRLAIWTSIGSNMKVFKPHWTKIQERYYKNYTGVVPIDYPLPDMNMPPPSIVVTPAE